MAVDWICAVGPSGEQLAEIGRRLEDEGETVLNHPMHGSTESALVVR